MEQGRSKDLEALAITERFAEELGKLGLSNAEIARRTGVELQRLRDVLRYKQRLPTDLLARSATIGIDLNYVLTGLNSHYSNEEANFLNNYRNSTKQGRRYYKSVGV